MSTIYTVPPDALQLAPTADLAAIKATLQCWVNLSQKHNSPNYPKVPFERPLPTVRQHITNAKLNSDDIRYIRRNLRGRYGLRTICVSSKQNHLTVYVVPVRYTTLRDAVAELAAHRSLKCRLVAHVDHFFFMKLTFLITPIKIKFHMPSYLLLALMPCHSRTVMHNGISSKVIRQYHPELNERTGIITIEEENIKLRATDIDSGWMEANFT